MYLPVTCFYVFWIIMMQVRSATLDAWLPEQVTFIQCKHHLFFGWGVFLNWSQVTSKLRCKVLKVILFLFSFSLLTAMPLWGMRNHIAIGKQSCPLIMTQLQLKISFIQRITWQDVEYYCFDWYRTVLLLCSGLIRAYDLGHWFMLGIKKKDWFEGMQRQYLRQGWVKRRGSINRPGPGSNGWHAFTENIEHSSKRKAVSLL